MKQVEFMNIQLDTVHEIRTLSHSVCIQLLTFRLASLLTMPNVEIDAQFVA